MLIFRRGSVSCSVPPIVPSTMAKDSDQLSQEQNSNDLHQSAYYFFPPLVMQRRSFSMEFIKRKRIHSVLELGCGEGTLLGLLTHPATSLDEFPPSQIAPSLLKDLKKDLVEDRFDDPAYAIRLKAIQDQILPQVPRLSAHEQDLHLSHLIGIDIDPNRLRSARQSISPTNLNFSSYSPAIRWEPLEVEIWQGDITVFNNKFVGIECVVMSEVIEHLWPDQLSKLEPLLFASYQPDWIIITTPNYEFNQHIDQVSSTENQKHHRFLDPTKRTNRIFRDSDHKFEWTRNEFKQWCDSISSEYHYDFEISGCGSYNNYFKSLSSPLSSLDGKSINRTCLPAPDCPEKFFATQIVIFQRRDKPQKQLQVTKDIIGSLGSQHRLLVSEFFAAHPLACQPSTPAKILEDVKDYFTQTNQTKVQLRELWLCKTGLDKLCGGKLLELLFAFSATDEWELAIDTSNGRRGMDAVWVTWLHSLLSNNVDNNTSSQTERLDDDSHSSSCSQSSYSNTNSSAWKGRGEDPEDNSAVELPCPNLFNPFKSTLTQDSHDGETWW
ncbi:hypothetical protein O181_065429 [Austropuccinia psidii MF-1]|uniref:Small RNA 2'-O-methyltransferase n=1 Tax=Austropuccinia psidii MF-1 TaxID=1389203 RepID=A0A9Q3I4J1_9BASI|nr:hypothetical protein [Austropuccinia psidii MF-1]